MWRKALALAIAVAAVFALHHVVVVPWRCGLIEGAVSRSTPSERSDNPIIRRRAQENVARILDCAERCKTNVNLAMLAGLNLMILGNEQAAIPLFEQALRYGQRPELYLALAIAQLEAGDREAALQNSIRAADFAGSSVLVAIPDGETRYRAHQVVGERHERMLLRSGRFVPQPIITGDFAAAGAIGTVSRLSGSGAAPSSAREWNIINVTGETTTRLEPSTRTPGRHALHVTTTRDGGGIKRPWPQDRYASRVRTTVWVFVKRGRVSIGSGNGKPPMANAYSTRTGRWEKLQAVNESCPAKMTVVQAASSDGAEFIVDEVRVHPTFAAPPCE